MTEKLSPSRNWISFQGKVHCDVCSETDPVTTWWAFKKVNGKDNLYFLKMDLPDLWRYSKMRDAYICGLCVLSGHYTDNEKGRF